MDEISITTEYITLVQFLKYCGVADNGSMANDLVRNGEVWVNGELCTMRGKKLRPGDTVAVLGRAFVIKAKKH